MAELKYTYALDKNENCIGIGNIDVLIAKEKWL